MCDPVRGLCELYGFEPHDPPTGTMVLALPAEQAQDALGILRQFNPAPARSAWCGRAIATGDPQQQSLGSRRYLELPQELLPRIC